MKPEAAIEMSPYDAELRASSAFYLANAGQFDKAIGLDFVGRRARLSGIHSG